MAKPEAHYHGHRKRLRERFLKGGLAGFAEHEVIEMLLTLAIPRLDVKQPAKALLERFGSLRGVLDAPLTELRSVKGIGEVASISLKVIREAATLYLLETSEEAQVLREPERLSDFWRMRIGHLKHEVFAVAYLDSAHRLLRNGVETLQEGTIDRAAVYPRRGRGVCAQAPGGGTRARAQPSERQRSSRASRTRWSRGPSRWRPRPSAFGLWTT